MSSRIKILHIIKSLGRGGAEMLLPETLSLHDKNKFEFHYIYFLPWKNQMVNDLQKNGGQVTCFPAKNNLELLRKVSKVAEYCKEQKIDIIHCHLPWSGFLGRMVHRKTGLPLIYTEHNIQERYHLVTKILNKYSFNSQNLALGVSKDVSESIMENIHPRISVQTLLNGVNTEKFTKDANKGTDIRDKYGIPLDAKVIGNIAVFREQKDIPSWIRAFKKIEEGNSNTFGLLVGAGPKENEIKSLIRELDLEEKIILPGLQTDTVSFFSAMDVFMMSSSFEGLPVALLEAMSMNCAVVSTKAGGVVEVIRDQEEGLLCETGDYEALGEAVLRILNNPGDLSNYQKKARKRVKESFSLRNMVEELEKIYGEFVTM